MAYCILFQLRPAKLGRLQQSRVVDGKSSKLGGGLRLICRLIEKSIFFRLIEHSSISLFRSLLCPTPTGSTDAEATVITCYHPLSASVPRELPPSTPVPPPMPRTPQQAPQLAPAKTARPAEVEGAPAPQMDPAASRLIVSVSRPARAAIALGAVRRRWRLKKQQRHLCRPPSAARLRAAACGT